MVKGQLTKLCNSKLSDQITFDYRNKQYRFLAEKKIKKSNTKKKEKTCKSIIFAGITRLLRELFYPNYDFLKVKYKSSYQAPSPSQRGNQKPTKNDIKDRDNGIKRGVLVHEQLMCYIKDKQKYAKIFGSEMHDYAFRILKSLEVWGLIPIAAEFHICDPVNKLATSIDAICINKKTNEIYVIDWKCASDNYFLHGNSWMLSILEPQTKKTNNTKKTQKDFEDQIISNSPLNQAFIQLAVMKEMLKRCYSFAPSKFIIVQVTSDIVKHYPLEDRINAKSKEIYDALVDYKTRKNILNKRK